MKKICILLCFFCLWGCTNKSLQKPCKIVVNIDGEVIPKVTVSNGRSHFNQEKMQLIIETDNASPIDISLSHDNYESVNLYISSKELMKKNVVKSVFFGEEKKSKISLSVITNAPAWDIKATGIDFKRSLKTFSGIVKRSEDVNINVTAGEDYRDVMLTIPKDLLITGTYKKDVILVKKDEAIIYFNNNIQGLIVTNYNTRQRFRLIQYDEGFYCVVKKNTEVLINNCQNVNYYKVNDDFHYQNSQVDNDILIKYSIESSPMQDLLNPSIYLYYLKNGHLTSTNLNFHSSNLTIPLGTQLFLIYPNEKGTRNIRFHYGFNPSSSTIFLTDDDFSEPIEFTFNARFYDRLAKEYLNELTIDNKKVYANENNEFVGLNKIPSLNNYNPIPFSYNLYKYSQGEFAIDYIITPTITNYILNFVDTNNIPLKVDAFNNDYIELATGRYIVKGLSDSQGQLLFYEGEESFLPKIKTNNHWITVDKALYSGMFTKVEISDQTYYELNEPIIIDQELYNLTLGVSNYTPAYGNISVKHNGNTYNNITTICNIHDIRVNDIIQIYISILDETYDITCTKEILEIGVLEFDAFYKKIIPIMVYTINLSSAYQYTYRSYNVVTDGRLVAINIVNNNLAEVYFYGNTINIKINYQNKNNEVMITKMLTLYYNQKNYYIN